MESSHWGADLGLGSNGAGGEVMEAVRGEWEMAIVSGLNSEEIEILGRSA